MLNAEEKINEISRKFEVVVIIVSILQSASFQYLSTLNLVEGELTRLGFMLYFPLVVGFMLWLIGFFIEKIDVKVIFIFNSWICLLVGFFVNYIAFEALLNKRHPFPYSNVLSIVTYACVVVFIGIQLYKDFYYIISLISVPEYFLRFLNILGIIVLGLTLFSIFI